MQNTNYLTKYTYVALILTEGVVVIKMSINYSIQ